MENELLIAIVAASSALGGVAISQGFSLLQSYFDREHQRRILLRTKYEELANHLNDSIVWANELLRVTTFKELHARTQPIAARRAYTLALLYFPRLKMHAERYVAASIAFQNVLVENFRPLDNVTAGAQAAKHSIQTFNAAGEHFRSAREAFDHQIQECANVYIAA